MLPRWVKVSGKRFNEILNTATEAKNKGLKINLNGSEFTLNSTETLKKDVGSGKINRNKFKRKYSNIIDDIKEVLNEPILTENQENIINILSLVGKIIKSKDNKTDEQPDTTDMSELESEGKEKV